MTLNAENRWRYTWEDLPVTDSNGNEITYSVKEVGESDGKVTISGSRFAVTIEDLGKEGFIIVNKKLIDISGSKTWNDNNNQDGKRPGSITIRLYADGRELTDKVQTVTASNGWNWKWEDLPKYANGTEITYTITEDAVENYTTVVDGYNVTNSYTPGKVDVPVTKSWNDGNNTDGHRPSSIKVKLMADGVDTGKRLTLNADNHWSGSFSDLDEKKNGQTISYTVEEESVNLYTGAEIGRAHV